MWEPTRQSRLLRRHPGSLGLLALLLSAAAALCLTPWEFQRHHKTSDDDIEVLYVFDDEALFQYRFPTFDGKRSYRLDLVRAVPGDEPEVATAIGDEIEEEQVLEIEEGCRIELTTGKKLLITGYAPSANRHMSLAELSQYEKTRKLLWWLIDEKTVVKAGTLDELAKAVPELKPALENLKLLKAADLFDHLKKEPDMALPKKAVAAQPGPSK